MNFPFYISKRYFFAKKSHSAINTISIISMIGVSVGAMALVVVLSVFNGFDELIKSLFNSFDPDLKITMVEGKSFTPDSIAYTKIENIKGVYKVAEVVEENALVQYREKQYISVIKGVSDSYALVSGVNKTVTEGKFLLKDGVVPFAVLGQGVAYYLGVGIGLGDPLVLYVPRRTAEVSMNPEEAFNRKYITPIGVFAIQQDFDSKYILVPIEFARKLLEYNKQVTALELKVFPGADVDNIQNEVKAILGKKFAVKNRYEQQELFYKIMKSEKWAIFFILTFILIVASFNIIGSLTMLIIDKKKDITVLNSLGATWKTIQRVFLFEGLFISLLGAMIGVVMGLLICWAQIQFDIVKLQSTGTFVIDSYPVKIVFADIMLVLLTVVVIGFITSWIPIRVVSKKYFE
jgi:lipoprotein-releasing system permease protein